MERCAECQSDGHKLEDVSRIAMTDYYRCPRCGAVWAAAKEPDLPYDNSETTPTDNENSPSS